MVHSPQVTAAVLADLHRNKRLRRLVMWRGLSSHLRGSLAAAYNGAALTSLSWDSDNIGVHAGNCAGQRGVVFVLEAMLMPARLQLR